MYNKLPNTNLSKILKNQTLRKYRKQVNTTDEVELWLKWLLEIINMF